MCIRDRDSSVRYYPPRTCVHAVIGGINFDQMLPLSARIASVLEVMRENGLTLTGDVLTRMVILRKSSKGFLSYQDAWFPVD